MNAIRKLSITFSQQKRILQMLGLIRYLTYRMTRSGRRLMLTIGGHHILIRKGTPDLSVALTSLQGEYEELHDYIGSEFGGVIVDAGGYIGTAALAFHEMYPAARIVTIEPSSRNAEILLSNVEGVDKIEVLLGALVGEKVGDRNLYDLGVGEWGFSTCSGAKGGVLLQQVNEIVLEDLESRFGHIGILKLDIEGGEYDLFKNQGNALNNVDVIVVELHERIVPMVEVAFAEFSNEYGREMFMLDGEKYVSVGRAAQGN